jgi:hypothetical protein
MERIQSNPEEISIQGRNGGMTAMHAACVRYPPARIIRALIEADPDSAVRPNYSGEAPLHLASYSASEEVQEILVRAKPQAAAMADQYGDLPLHFAARSGATPPLMEQFLYASPEAIKSQNIRQVTPFWLLPRSFLEAEDLEEILEEDSEDYRDDWDLLVLFLRYSYYGRAARSLTIEQYENYESWMVHAAASAPSCPREVLKFLCRMFPQQAVRYDAQGYTPLLHAASTPEMSEPEQWDEVEDGFREHVEVADGELRAEEEDSVDESTAALRTGDTDFVRQAVTSQHDRASSGNMDTTEEQKSETVVEILLEWSPRSIYYVNRQGRLPLAQALVSGRSWNSVRHLIAACPRVLEIRDKPTGLYMFQLAAMDSPDLDTIYTIVRSTHELLLMARRHDRNENENETMPSAKKPRAI